MKISISFKYFQFNLLLATLITNISGFEINLDQYIKKAQEYYNEKYELAFDYMETLLEKKQEKLPFKYIESEYYIPQYNEKLNLITLNPIAGYPDKSVIFLHGITNNATDIYEKFADGNHPFPKNYKIIIPQADIKFKKYNWAKKLEHPPKKIWLNVNNDQKPNMNDLMHSYHRIENIIDKEVEHYASTYKEDDGSHGRIICSGHGIGCFLSYFTGLIYPEHEIQKSIIGFSGEFLNMPIFDRVESQYYHENENWDLNMFLVHGTQDNVIPFAEAYKAVERTKQLEKKNFEFHWVEGMSHELREESYDLVREFIKKHD